MDPVTGAIVSYLSATAAGMAGPASAEVGKLMVKDAYQALKTSIQKKFGSESKPVKAMSELEKEPDFTPSQDALAGRLAQVGAATDKDLLKLAAALADALKNSTEGQAALTKYQVSITDSEVGVLGDHAHVEGGIHFGNK